MSRAESFKLLKKDDDFALNYHIAIVFPLKKVDDHYVQHSYTKSIISTLVTQGELEVFPYYANNNTDLIVLVKLPEEKMKRYADKVNFTLKLMPEKARAELEKVSDFMFFGNSLYPHGTINLFQGILH
jgi:hypothetical protein